MLRPISIPGLLVTGTDTGVGKTLVAGAIAAWLRTRDRARGGAEARGKRVRPSARRLVSEDAEFLAQCADARQPLDVIAPQRFIEPLAPAVAARRAGVTLDWSAIQRSIDAIAHQSDVMIVEGVGGIMVPMDEEHTMLDVAMWLKLPAVVVARAALGTINHTILTVDALRRAGVTVAGVVINRYPTDTPAVAEETNPKAIEKWGKTPILCLVPEVKAPIVGAAPADVMSAVAQVDWTRFASAR